MNVYLRSAREGELTAINQLSSQAGERGFTYLGRHVTKEMIAQGVTPEELLKKFPEGELESAASMRFFTAHPEFIRMLYDSSWRIDDKRGMSILKKMRIMGGMGGAAGAGSGAAQANAPDANQDALSRVKKMYEEPQGILEYRVVKEIFGDSAAQKFLQVMQGIDELLIPRLAKMTGGQ